MTPSEARSAFAEFPEALRLAMKSAAVVEGWSSAQWVEETALVADLLHRPDHTFAVETALLTLYGRIVREAA